MTRQSNSPGLNTAYTGVTCPLIDGDLLHCHDMNAAQRTIAAITLITDFAIVFIGCSNINMEKISKFVIFNIFFLKV